MIHNRHDGLFTSPMQTKSALLLSSVAWGKALTCGPPKMTTVEGERCFTSSIMAVA